MNEYKKCGMCRTRTHISEFKIKKGLTLKTCNRCLESQKVKNEKNKCEHGKQRTICKDCGGNSICEHHIQRYRCYQCGGSSVCEHNRQRHMCIQCKGSQVCEHNRIYSSCKECTDSIYVIIQQWIHVHKHNDIKNNRYNNQEFITFEHCQKLIEDSHHKCCYCSIPLQPIIQQNNLMTIERIDNSIGHIIGNCTIACYHCNVSRVGQRI